MKQHRCRQCQSLPEKLTGVLLLIYVCHGPDFQHSAGKALSHLQYWDRVWQWHHFCKRYEYNLWTTSWPGSIEFCGPKWRRPRFANWIFIYLKSYHWAESRVSWQYFLGPQTWLVLLCTAVLSSTSHNSSGRMRVIELFNKTKPYGLAHGQNTLLIIQFWQISFLYNINFFTISLHDVQ